MEVIVHASALGFSDQAGADALAKGLLEKPPTTSFGKCEVTAASAVANEKEGEVKQEGEAKDNVAEAQQAQEQTAAQFDNLSDLSGTEIEADSDKGGKSALEESSADEGEQKDGLPDLSEIQKPGEGDTSQISDTVDIEQVRWIKVEKIKIT